jgi:hypothetical protein
MSTADLAMLVDCKRNIVPVCLAALRTTHHMRIAKRWNAERMAYEFWMPTRSKQSGTLPAVSSADCGSLNGKHSEAN